MDQPISPSAWTEFLSSDKKSKRSLLRSASVPSYNATSQSVPLDLRVKVRREATLEAAEEGEEARTTLLCEASQNKADSLRKTMSHPKPGTSSSTACHSIPEDRCLPDQATDSSSSQNEDHIPQEERQVVLTKPSRCRDSARDEEETTPKRPRFLYSCPPSLPHVQFPRNKNLSRHVQTDPTQEDSYIARPVKPVNGHNLQVDDVGLYYGKYFSPFFPVRIQMSIRLFIP